MDGVLSALQSRPQEDESRTSAEEATCALSHEEPWEEEFRQVRELLANSNKEGAILSVKLATQEAEEEEHASDYLQTEGGENTFQDNAGRQKHHNHRRQRAIVVLDVRNKVIMEFQSQQEAALQLGINQSSVSLVVNGKQEKTGGYRFRLKSEWEKGLAAHSPKQQPLKAASQASRPIMLLDHKLQRTH